MNRAAFTYLIQKKSSILSAIAFISLSIIIAVIAFYQGYNRNLSRQKVIELTAVTNLKANDLSIWYNYRIKDVSDLSKNDIFKSKLESYLLRQNYNNRKNLFFYLDSLRIEKESTEICIASPEGRLLFTTDSLSEGLDMELKDSVISSARSHKALSNDLYLCQVHKKRHIDFLSTVTLKDNQAPVIVVLRIDPEKTLFPLVRAWPSEGNVTKNLLVRVKGDSLLLLSSPVVNNRFQMKTISSLNLPDGKSLQNYEGVTKLINPLNRKELAYVRPIKGTSWYLVSMLTKQNTFRQFGNSRMIFVLSVLSVLLFIVGILLVYMLYQRNSYIKLFLSQEEFRITLYSIGDAVITTDKQGHIKAMNHVASEMTGYKEREAKGKSIDSVLHIINETTRERVMDPTQRVLEEGRIVGLSSNSILISKDGKDIPVSDSGAPIRDANGDITGVVLVFRDETADREKQKIIEESEKKYRNLFNSTNDGLCQFKVLKDNNGNPADVIILGTNPNFELLSGEKEENLVNKKVSELQDGRHNPYLATAFGKLSPERKVCFESYNNATKKHLYVTIYPNSPDVYVMVLQDITERKKAELRQKALYMIADSMLTSPSLSELSNLIISQLESILENPEIRIELYGNPVKNISSLSFEGTKCTSRLEKPEEGSIQSYSIKLGKALILDKEGINRLLKERHITHGPENFNSFIVLPLLSNTVSLATLTIGSVDVNAFDESLITFLEIIINQTRNFIDRKVYEDEIIKLSKGIIQSPVSIIITDKDSIIEYVNPKYLQVTGLKSEDLIGKKYADIRKNFMPADSFEDMITKLSDSKEWSGELLSTTQKGEQIWESIHISPIFDNKGNISHYISIRDDITEEKNMIEKLIIAKEKAEESDRLKTSFLANMSHEVRTPMNAIIGFAELLSFRDITKAEQMEYSQVIKQRSYELLAIIDDIIDVSRLETGKLKMFKLRVNIKDILADVYNTACTVWLESGKSSVSLELVDDEPGLEIPAFTDTGRLRQVLTNLIDNAFKFTEKGVIKFGCMDNGDGSLLFYVSDTGIGIPEDKQSLIFERFRQVEEDYSRKKGGIGLGLSICKGLVELLEGNIWVKSEPGKGSTFFFTISQGNGEPEEKETKKVIQMINQNEKGIWLNRRLLVIEDEPLNARYIKNALDPSGINIVHTDTGVDALEIIKRDQFFDAILLDIRLPDIDGFELARLIKSINSKLIIIAQTAYASEQYRTMCIDAGCDDYIAKPFKVQDLFEVLRKYL
jgi:PAS domain S-box-containing protein